MTPLVIAVVVLLVIAIAWFVYYWATHRHPAHALGQPVAGRVWGYPNARHADQIGGSLQACEALCEANPSCVGYNYLPGSPPYCYNVLSDDFSKYSLCVVKKPGEHGWLDASRINSGLWGQVECPAT